MAAHVETGTMADPRYERRNLGHLGLVAGIFEELGIGEAIDRMIPQEREKRVVSVGQAVKALVLNGLGFVNQRLYLVPHFFQDKPTERLIGAGIRPEHLNDDVTGRALERLYEHDVTTVYARLASQAVRRLGLTPRFGHLDTTSFHVDGQYHSDTPPEAGVIHITRGYSRDHRPDLNQVVLELIAENQAGIPLWRAPLSGNCDDKTSLRATVKAHLGQLRADEGLGYVVADSALYTAETLRALAGMAWITRVPETLNAAREAIQAAAPRLMRSLDKMSLQGQAAEMASVKQRWVGVYSPQAYQRALKSVNRQCEKQSEADLKAFEALCRRDFACPADAKKALAAFEKGRWLCAVPDFTVVEVPHYPKRGRPCQGQAPKALTYRIEGALASRPEQRTLRRHRKSCFILATHPLDTEALSDEALLAAYKGQQPVERGFRFLKDPLFLASSLYSRIPKASDGADDGHDLMFVGLCGPGIPPASGPPESDGKADPKPYPALGLPALCGHSPAPHPGGPGPCPQSQ